MLQVDIPYRLSLLRDGLRPTWMPPCQHTNQAFEAGATSGRILLSFLGIGCDPKSGALKPARRHESQDGGQTDDVKARDIGGRFVEIGELSEHEKVALANFIRGVNKACAHFTIGSNHKLDQPVYAEAAPIIFRLIAECFPDHARSWPKWGS